MATISVIGPTSWGTTLATINAREGHHVTLIARSEREARSLDQPRENIRFLPGTTLPANLKITSSLDDGLERAEILILAVPSSTLRQNAKTIRDSLDSQTTVVTATKGLEVGSRKRMSEVLLDELPSSFANRVCALSGPNLAREIVLGKPASTVLASPNADTAKFVQSIMNSPTFRVYTNTDMVGVELAGALKNIIAIGAGIADGLQLGDNSKAGLMTRGLAEITRLGIAAGAKLETFAGLAGMGDLIATCSSTLSRNHQVGVELAKGIHRKEILAKMHHVAEGVDTTAAARSMAHDLKVDMPITETTYQMLFEGLSADHAVTRLMDRRPVSE